MIFARKIISITRVVEKGVPGGSIKIYRTVSLNYFIKNKRSDYRFY